MEEKLEEMTKEINLMKEERDNRYEDNEIVGNTRNKEESYAGSIYTDISEDRLSTRETKKMIVDKEKKKEK